MNLPQLPREPLREDLESDVDREIWQPSWRCFCCEDTGVVRFHLVLCLIPDYDRKYDKDAACQHPRCRPQHDRIGDENFDQRFDQKICIELDKANRENWRQYVKNQFENAQKAQAAIEALGGKAMPGSRGRDANDERKIQIRKEEIEISLQKAQEGGVAVVDEVSREEAW